MKLHKQNLPKKIKLFKSQKNFFDRFFDNYIEIIIKTTLSVHFIKKDESVIKNNI